MATFTFKQYFPQDLLKATPIIPKLLFQFNSIISLKKFGGDALNN